MTFSICYCWSKILRGNERWVDENVTPLEFETIDNKKYKVKDIQDSNVYANKSKAGHLLELYYLVS